MVSVKSFGNMFSVFQNGKTIGEICLYENSLHGKNAYLKFDFSIDDEADCKILFSEIRGIAKKPLQVMTYSNEAELIRTLLCGGFVLRRKCYETEASKEDYIGKTVESDLKLAVFGEEKYEAGCHLIYERYLETHKDINPWTAGYAAFCSELPKALYFEENENGTENLAFVEENEIAYVCGRDFDSFVPFAEKLVSVLFEKYETVCFESDDCDSIAMVLKSLFKSNDEPSYDTYVYV